jgi:hypothetical protein
MQSILLRLLALIAVMLLPFGMSAAPAEAREHHSASTLSMQHCSQEESDRAQTDALSDCAMPCSAALPAADPSSAGSHSLAPPAVMPPTEEALTGIDLDIATPPPKLS